MKIDTEKKILPKPLQSQGLRLNHPQVSSGNEALFAGENMTLAEIVSNIRIVTGCVVHREATHNDKLFITKVLSPFAASVSPSVPDTL